MEWYEAYRISSKDIRSIAYVHVPSQRRSKLDDRSEKHVFVGYDKQSKGYKLYNLVTRKVVVGRDVEFEEEGSWDWSIEENERYDFLPMTNEEETGESGEATGGISCRRPRRKWLRNSQSMINELMKSMTREFEMTDIGLMSYYLGIEVKQMDEGIFCDTMNLPCLITEIKNDIYRYNASLSN
ncbi:retrovirus-related pol polyprotein from transposon TNT 1-94 [Tanacetum coccineum]